MLVCASAVWPPELISLHRDQIRLHPVSLRLLTIHIRPVTIWQMWVPKIRPGVEGFFEIRNAVVRLPNVIEEANPENGDRAVVLRGVTSEFGDMSNGEVCDMLSILNTVGAIEKGPCKTKMGLVAKVLPGFCLMKNAEAIAKVELCHPAPEASSRNSWKEAWMALMNASESGRVL